MPNRGSRFLKVIDSWGMVNDVVFTYDRIDSFETSWNKSKAAE